MFLNRVLYGLVALGFSAIALYMSATFWMETGRSSTEANIFLALAALSTATKLLVPSAAAMVRGHLLLQLSLWAGFVGALCFDAIGTAGYVEMTYGAKSGAITQEAKDYKDAEGRRDDAKRSFEEYSDAKGSVAEADLALKSAKAEAGVCGKTRAHLDVCKAVTAAETVLARITERERRGATLAELQSKLDKLAKPSVSSDAQAAILAKLGSRIGWDGLPNFVTLIISVLIFLFFEIVAPTMSSIALRGGIGKPAVKPPERRAKPPDADAPPPRRPRAAKGSGDVFAFLSELVAGSRSAPDIVVSGRKVYGAQRAIGQALGVSGAAVNRQLAALCAAGVVAMNTDGRRTEIELLS